MFIRNFVAVCTLMILSISILSCKDKVTAPEPERKQVELQIVAGLTVGADGNTVVPVAAPPSTLLYYRRTGLPILAPDGHHITAGEFVTAKGTAVATCLNSGTEVKLSMSGLIPNALYRVWILIFKEPGFDIGPPPDFSNLIGGGHWVRMIAATIVS